MVRLRYKLVLLLLVQSFALLTAGHKAKEQTRQIQKTFEVKPGVLLDVYNKYGDITLTTWDRDEISFDILISVNSTDGEKTTQFLKLTDIEWSKSSNRIQAHTKYPDPDEHKWLAGWSNNCNNITYSVTYAINIPERIDLELQNKYGNITCSSPISGNVFIANKYGDISTEDINGDVNIQLYSGKAYMGNASNVNLNISKGKIKLDNTEIVNSESKYSNIQINECTSLVSTSKYDNIILGRANEVTNTGKYDDWKIKKVGNITMSTKLTNCEIGFLANEGTFETKKGKVLIKGVGQNLGKVIIDSKYTYYELILEKDFHVDFEGDKTSFYIDEPFEKYHYEKDNDTKYVKLYRNNKYSDTKIIAHMKEGELVID